MKKLVLILVVLSFASCASRHRLMQGTVALKINETKGIACLESNKAKPGMKLFLLNTDCEATPLRDIESCLLVESGEAVITRILNDHYAEFKISGNATFAEGSIIRFSKK